jgi:hypothetical protein
MSILQRKSERIEHLAGDLSKDINMFDISPTGACCTHDKRLEKGGFVAVHVNDVPLRARVAYCQERKEGFRVGLEFWNVSADKRTMIEEFIEGYSRGVPVSCTITGAAEEEAPGRGKKKGGK